MHGVVLAMALALGVDDPRVVLENDHVRVTEWLASEGEPLPVRDLSPGVLINLNRVRLSKNTENGDASIVDYLPGEIMWVEEFTDHQWEPLTGIANFFIVEIKSAGAQEEPATWKLGDRDSAIIDPVHHKPVLENGHVRVIDGMASAGATSAMHSHPPSVLVSLAKSRFRVTSRGNTHMFDFEPHQVTWINAFEHEWEVLSGDARVIVVEVKSAGGFTN